MNSVQLQHGGHHLPPHGGYFSRVLVAPNAEQAAYCKRRIIRGALRSSKAIGRQTRRGEVTQMLNPPGNTCQRSTSPRASS